MKYLIRLSIAAALVTVCMIAAVIVADGADLKGDWLLEDLTCAELQAGYGYNIEELQSMLSHYQGCFDYYKGMEEQPHGLVHCALIKKQGQYLQGLTNDIVNVFNTKCAE